MPTKWEIDNCERQIRKLINEESEAINSYNDAAAMLEQNFPEAASLFKDIADEERAHIGELQGLYSILFPANQQKVAEGYEEAMSKLDSLVKQDIQDASMMREVIPPVQEEDPEMNIQIDCEELI